MYALMTLLSAGIEAGADAVSKKVGRARRRRAINKAEPVTDAGTGRPREVSGRAVAGPAGQVTAPLSGEPCVWYAVTVSSATRPGGPALSGPTRVDPARKVGRAAQRPAVRHRRHRVRAGRRARRRAGARRAGVRRVRGHPERPAHRPAGRLLGGTAASAAPRADARLRRRGARRHRRRSAATSSGRRVPSSVTW